MLQEHKIRAKIKRAALARRESWRQVREIRRTKELDAQERRLDAMRDPLLKNDHENQ